MTLKEFMAIYLLSLLLVELRRWLSGKESSANVEDTRDVGLIPGSGSNGNPLQDSCLENSMDRGAWVGAMVHGATQSRT